MKKDNIKDALALYLVTDQRWLNGRKLEEDVEKALQGGVTFVQLREKNTTKDAFIDQAKRLKTLCHHYQVPLIINDNIEVMLAVDADGVHVGQKDMKAQDVRKLIGPKKILGVSARTLEQAQNAQDAGADYLGVGAVFKTNTKTDAKDLNMDTLKDICTSINIPVVAIGGIEKDNVDQLKGTHISGIAVVSAIMAQENISDAAKQLKKKVKDIINA